MHRLQKEKQEHVEKQHEAKRKDAVTGRASSMYLDARERAAAFKKAIRRNKV